jgi:hypothetical protein
MDQSESCPECGVPKYINNEHLWLNNGDLVQRREARHRLIFIESENLDPLFRNIEQIIGVPVEHIVIASVRRVVRLYLSPSIPKGAKELILKKEIEYTVVSNVIRNIGRIMGYGGFELLDMRYEQDEDDYCIDRITDPFSLLFACASQAATIETLTDCDQGVTYEKVSPGIYNITAFPSPHPEELKKRMWLDYYYHQDGDMELERCATCGGPKALSAYQWHPDRGVIANRSTKRRMVIIGPQMLDPVFSELEAELGDTIPRVVVEAQRRFTKTGFYTMEDVSDEWDFRTQLALRGLGNLHELKIRRRGLRMRLDNAVLPLMIVGMMQGIFDAAFDLDSTVDWELSEEGSLEIEITPRG